jgi:hypothetical protein
MSKRQRARIVRFRAPWLKIRELKIELRISWREKNHLAKAERSIR